MAPVPRSPTSPVRLLVGSVTFLFFALNTVFWCLVLYAVTLLRILVPSQGWRRLTSAASVWIGEVWIAGNTRWLQATQPTRWDYSGLEGLDPKASYVVVSNHVSLVDIPVLQGIFLHRIPFLRFFIKQELIKVPLLGAAWWALDFPFMKRYTREYLEQHPDKRGEDLATTRKACEKFRRIPVSMLNFAEGTRFTPAKKARRGSPYQHLLLPKAGGLAFTVASLGATLRSMIDVTIVYPGGAPNFWDAISRGIPWVIVRMREVPIPADWFTGDYQEDAEFRERVQTVVRELWQEKDAHVGRLLAESAGASGSAT